MPRQIRNSSLTDAATNPPSPEGPQKRSRRLSKRRTKASVRMLLRGVGRLKPLRSRL